MGKSSDRIHCPASGYTSNITPDMTLRMPESSESVGAKPVCVSNRMQKRMSTTPVTSAAAP